MPNGGSLVSRSLDMLGVAVLATAMRPWVKSTAAGVDDVEGAAAGRAVATESRRAEVVA